MELERAKRAAVAVICNALESKATSAEDIGRQFLTYGKRCVRLRLSRAGIASSSKHDVA